MIINLSESKEESNKMLGVEACSCEEGLREWGMG